MTPSDVKRETGKEKNLDELLRNHLGRFGLYQFVLLLLFCLPAIPLSMQVFAWTFTGAQIPFRCLLPNEPSNSSFEFTNDTYGISANDLKCKRPNINSSISLHEGAVTDGLFGWTLNSTLFSTETCKGGYSWDTSEIKWSAVNRWNLVCDREWIVAFVYSCTFMGQLFGSVFWGFVGDRFGRKVGFILATLVQIVAGIVAAFVPYWQAYAFLRFLLGSCHYGILYLAIVGGQELVGPSKRMLGAVPIVFWACGETLLGVVAWAIRDYQYLQLAVTLPGIPFLAYWWFIPESFRWLLAKRKLKEAEKVLLDMEKHNRIPLPANWQNTLNKIVLHQAHPLSIITTMKLVWKSRILRIRLLVSVAAFTFVGMIFYGVSINPSFKGGDRYSTFIMSGGVEIPAVIVALVSINFLGRKLLTILTFTIAGIALALTLVVPAKLVGLTVALVIIAKCAAAMTFTELIVMVPELFPTNVRSTVTGTCSGGARIGAFAATWFSKLLVSYSMIGVVLTFAGAALLSAALLMLIPEATGYALPETTKEAEEFSAGQRWYTFKFNRRNTKQQIVPSDVNLQRMQFD